MVGPLGGAEGEDRGQMGCTRMKEQKLTAELAAVKIKKNYASGRKEVEGRRGKG